MGHEICCFKDLLMRQYEEGKSLLQCFSAVNGSINGKVRADERRFITPEIED